jgi:peptidoglycan/LPS O-acetylase OafA/YrhL
LLLEEKKRFADISIRDFYIRRILRIWPLYFLILVTMAAIPPLFFWPQLQIKYYLPFLTNIIAPYMLFVGNYFILTGGNIPKELWQSLGGQWLYYATLIAPLWSLCIEEQFYLVWPWVLKLVRRTGAIWMVCGSLTVVSIVVRAHIFMQVHLTQQGSEAYRWDTFCHLDALMFGAMLAIAERQKPGWAKPLVAGWRGAVVLIAVLGVYGAAVMCAPGVVDKHASIVPLTTLFALAYAALLVLALNWRPAISVLSNQFLVSIGRVSYAMYLFHFFIVASIIGYLPDLPSPEATWWLRVTAVFAVTFAAAKASWFLLESRMLSLRKYFNRSLQV